MQIIFLNILLVGAGIVLWLLIRALPRMEKEVLRQKGWFELWLTSELPGKIDTFASALWLRSLRRFKVLVLRIDNSINDRLQRMKLESGDGIKGDKIDLKKVVEDRAAEAEGAANEED
ncbi:MAG: hypothetical protein A2855_01180 [Candidatus Liptonbacteria bacterium RIFCSPHIGHO2_01_FULL_57_28]|uniref:Uncharacterized protein n=1 Tax=Candidatus Liptonbacteria bacterium RIFCSPHIGHO2_01_FULL_57_28 TaxID=1798647 RepID=A0A1G2CAW4_9BACT|nr:MAG: hypothetical protein A2855_01180 [Candidatus Liptonbacteria bacterium RIFCSPHIGHO2_01_FULL_57_28]